MENILLFLKVWVVLPIVWPKQFPSTNLVYLNTLYETPPLGTLLLLLLNTGPTGYYKTFIANISCFFIIPSLKQVKLSF